MVEKDNGINNAIIYKYNKYTQVNGTLFYAFDYLLKVVENQIQNPNQNKLLFYIIIPTKFKKNYLLKLLHMFRTKYPIWYKNYFRDKKLFDIAKNNLSEQEYKDLEYKIMVCLEAYSRIKLISPTELLRKKFDSVLIPCYNSYNELYKNIDAKKIHVFQNRRNLENDNLEIKINQNSETIFYYELGAQGPRTKEQNELRFEHYIPKLALDYIVPKEIYKSFPRSEYIIAGEPIVNQNNSFNFGYTTNKKPSLFLQIPKTSDLETMGLQEPSFFLNTIRIDYYQNFVRFDENNRIIPEARYLNIPIRVIKEETKYLKNIDNLPVGKSELKNLIEDSSVTRLTNDLSNYTLTSLDKIVQLLS